MSFRIRFLVLVFVSLQGVVSPFLSQMTTETDHNAAPSQLLLLRRTTYTALTSHSGPSLLV